MKILVPGATGMVGRHVVEQALRRGHEVTAIARHPESLGVEHPRLSIERADITKAESVEPLLESINAVMSTVGIGTPKEPTTLYSDGTRNLLGAMQHHGVSRIVVISSEVADHWAHQGLLKLWVVLPLLQKFLGATYDDMRRMDIVLWESSAPWTAIRAPRIRSTEGQGRYRLNVGRPLRRGWTITAPDMATALLDIAERQDLGRAHVYLAN